MPDFESTLWTLISRARAGDEAALLAFARRYRPPVIAYCRRRGLSPEDAEDAAQEVMLRFFCRGVLERADRSRGRFRHLMLAVARNVVRQHWERQSACKRGAGHIQPLGEADVADDTPDEQFDREWTRHLIDLALQRLAEQHAHYHEALRRFLLDQQPYARIAAELGVAEGDVKNYVHRGKRKLIEFLRDEVRDYSLAHDEYADELVYLARYLERPPRDSGG
jgi:RNA polymerase sigma-70 factor (ECF subfamily)